MCTPSLSFFPMITLLVRISMLPAIEQVYIYGKLLATVCYIANQSAQ